MDTKRAAAKTPPCKLLLRITATLTNAFRAAKIAPQRVAKDLNYLSAPNRHHQRHRHGAYRSRFGVIGHARVKFLSG